MVLRPDRPRYWLPWRRRWWRLIVTVPTTLMLTLLLLAMDWTALRNHGVGWLVTIAWFLLYVLWLIFALILASLALVVVALRVDHVELESGRVRRHLVFGRIMEVPLEGASLTRGPKRDVVVAPGVERPLRIPHLFYAPEQLDRLWEAAGLTQAPSSDPR